MERVLVHVRIDEDFIASHDAFEILDPVWWRGNIYGTHAEYEESLADFSRPQRLFLAMEWYRAEVGNGGHHQFYSNSTGIVWRDALEGFELLALGELAAVLSESAERMRVPSFDRDARQDFLDSEEPDFDDLDTRLYDLDDGRLDEAMLRYARAHPTEFVFEGVVEKPAPIDG